MNLDELKDWLAPNTAFSKALPGMQTAVNASSLGEFKQCPRKYFYGVIAGYQGLTENVHLRFGVLVHEACEKYWGLRQSQGHEEALQAVVLDALRKTWDKERQAPWLSASRTKNRNTLLMAIIAFLDERQEDEAKILSLADGRAATELTFRFASGYRVFSTGEAIDLCGTLDKIVEFAGEKYFNDYKTTEKPLDREYIKSFTPGGQFSQYTLAGQVAYEFDIKGGLVDAIRIGPEGAEFMRFPVPRSKAALAEWHHDLGKWVKKMETCALEAQSLSSVESAWEQNDHACTRCAFRDVCATPPGSDRERALKAGFRQRRWDPLVRRQDV